MRRQKGEKNANKCNSRSLGEAVEGWEAVSALAFTDLHNFSWMFVPLGNIVVYVAISTHYSGGAWTLYLNHFSLGHIL